MQVLRADKEDDDDGDVEMTTCSPYELNVPQCLSCPCGLGILEKGGINVLELEQTDWIELPKPVVIDSGASETVMPEDWLPTHEIRESPGSKKNQYYVMADGGKVCNEGQQEVVVSTMDGSQCRKMVFQVAAVKKALGSVSQMVRNGNKVVFDMDEYDKNISYILHKNTGGKIPVRYENGVYVLDMLVSPPGYNCGSNDKGFHGPGW